MIYFTKIQIKSNNLGKESLVPDFKGGGSVPSFKYKNGFIPDMLKGFNEGMVEGVLPYSIYSVYVDVYKKIIKKQTGKEDVTNKDVDTLYPIKKDLDFRLD